MKTSTRENTDEQKTTEKKEKRLLLWVRLKIKKIRY